MRDAWILFVSFGALTGISWLSLSKTQRQWLQTWLIRGMGALLAGLILFREGPWEFFFLVFLGVGQALLFDSLKSAPLWILGWCIASRSFSFLASMGALAIQKPVSSFALLLFSSLALKFCGPWKERASSEPSLLQKRLQSALRILALMALVPLCAQFSHMMQQGIDHHIGAFVGPIEMLRQGGLIGWDVPIQYGTLMAWVIAQLPFQHALHSFVFFNSIVIWTACSVLFWAGMTCFRGVLGLLFSFLLSVGSIIALVSPSDIPSSGPLRFIFCFLLLAGWFWGRPFQSRGHLLALSGIWLVGCGWSFESACYCSAVHFSGLLSHGLPSPEEASPRTRWRLFGSSLKRLIVPLLILGLVLILVAGIFKFSTGHFPDLMRSTDFARSFALGFTKKIGMYVRPSPLGALWIPLGMMFLFFFYPTSRASHSLVGLGGIWILISYYIGRGHEHNILNVTSLFLLCLYKLFSTDQSLPKTFQRLLKAWGIPLVSGWLLIAHLYGDVFHRLEVAFSHPFSFLEGTPVDYLAPLNAEVQALFLERGLDPGGPWVMSSQELPYGKVLPRAWVPLFPGALLGALSGEARWIYWRRFVERTQSSGWVLIPPERFIELPPELTRTHRLTGESFSASGKWKLLHFEILPREEWVW